MKKRILLPLAKRITEIQVKFDNAIKKELTKIQKVEVLRDFVIPTIKAKDFSQKHLNLGCFLPAELIGDKWVELKELNSDTFSDYKSYDTYQVKFNNALNNVLFEGITLRGEGDEAQLYYGEENWDFTDIYLDELGGENQVIEELFTYSVQNDWVLTENAKKELGYEF